MLSADRSVLDQEHLSKKGERASPPALDKDLSWMTHYPGDCPADRILAGGWRVLRSIR